ncbi:hypothetical protein JW962_02915 [Candidatus Dojkabacteria bacterium]|nr:hypothetical protein [Candidatus Dojkabacteria bacterium]
MLSGRLDIIADFTPLVGQVDDSL